MCKNGKLLKALELQDDIWGKDFMLDILSYNAIIDGCCKKGKIEVENMIKFLKKDGLLPNFFSWKIVCTMLLSLCSTKSLALLFL